MVCEWFCILCLLLMFVLVSRCCWINDVVLSSEGYFFVVVCYFFEGGLMRLIFIFEW